MTENIFDVVVGKGILRWDAAWRVIAWLATPAEGHGLGEDFRDKLTAHCFGEPAPAVETRIEFKIGLRDGEGKWVDMLVAHPSVEAPRAVALLDDISLRSPNDSRKIGNFNLYAELAAARYPQAALSLVPVTNGRDPRSFAKLQESLGRLPGVRVALLPLHRIGEWIEAGPSGTSDVVRAFGRWAMSH